MVSFFFSVPSIVRVVGSLLEVFGIGSFLWEFGLFSVFGSCLCFYGVDLSRISCGVLGVGLF